MHWSTIGESAKVANMRGVYRHSRSECIACGICVVFFAALLALLLALAWKVDSVRSPWGLSALLVCVVGSMLVLSLWGLLECLLARLEIDDDLIVRADLFCTRSVCLSGLTAVRWRLRSVVLISPAGHLRIPLDLIERHQILEFVRRLRNAVPIEQQTGWEWFFQCSVLHMIRCQLLPGPGEFVATRRRWNVIFAIALIPAAAVGWFSWHVTRQPRLLLIPLSLLPFWLLVWRSTPRRGMIVRSSLDKVHGSRAFLIQWLCIFLLACTGMVVNAVYEDSIQGLNAVLIAGSILLMALLLLAAHQQDRKTQTCRQRKHAELVAQYDWITGWPHEIDFERKRGAN
jgi:hypothetical protein